MNDKARIPRKVRGSTRHVALFAGYRESRNTLRGGIIKYCVTNGANFIAGCDGIKPADGADGPAIVGLLVEKEIISGTCGDAFNRIWRSFRCDVHHMNPKVATIPFAELARRNIQDIATIEREVFAFEVNNGMIRPLKPKYWNPPKADGTTDVYLRIRP